MITTVFKFKKQVCVIAIGLCLCACGAENETPPTNTQPDTDNPVNPEVIPKPEVEAPMPEPEPIPEPMPKPMPPLIPAPEPTLEPGTDTDTVTGVWERCTDYGNHSERLRSVHQASEFTNTFTRFRDQSCTLPDYDIAEEVLSGRYELSRQVNVGAGIPTYEITYTALRSSKTSQTDSNSIPCYTLVAVNVDTLYYGAVNFREGCNQPDLRPTAINMSDSLTLQR